MISFLMQILFVAFFTFNLIPKTSFFYTKSEKKTHEENENKINTNVTQEDRIARKFAPQTLFTELLIGPLVFSYTAKETKNS